MYILALTRLSKCGLFLFVALGLARRLQLSKLVDKAAWDEVLELLQTTQIHAFVAVTSYGQQDTIKELVLLQTLIDHEKTAILETLVRRHPAFWHEANCCSVSVVLEYFNARSDFDVMETLLINVDASSRQPEDPGPCLKGKLEVVTTYLKIARNQDKTSSDLPLQGSAGPSALHLAAQSGNVPVMRTLLVNLASVDNNRWVSTCMSPSPRTPLSMAAKHGHVEAIELLLWHKANCDGVGPDQYSPLRFAVTGGHVSAARVLLEQGAQVRWEGMTSPLQLAVETSDLDMVQLLIAYEADACERWSIPMYSVLQEAIKLCGEQNEAKGGPINSAEGALEVKPEDQAERSPEESDRIRIVRVLLQCGADPNIVDKESGTAPLHTAIKNVNNAAVVEMLIDYGVDISVRKMKEGPTPLHMAVLKQNAAIVELLLSNGADTNAPAHMSIPSEAEVDRRPVKFVGTAIELAARNRYANGQVVKVFREYLQAYQAVYISHAQIAASTSGVDTCYICRGKRTEVCPACRTTDGRHSPQQALLEGVDHGTSVPLLEGGPYDHAGIKQDNETVVGVVGVSGKRKNAEVHSTVAVGVGAGATPGAQNKRRKKEYMNSLVTQEPVYSTPAQAGSTVAQASTTVTQVEKETQQDRRVTRTQVEDKISSCTLS
ncbi:hypothetical protein SARC_02955 [Sphaeroforma arctica JP610]|uniref:Uncharacterized protein n=1 Tax=Sphaeroforma arctica JP610 TaxID=667725 RepID=A0A0L0G7E6_9EUKA|nr:hypothetical protein SARC_02955 [Sphaeroforma arctica JP610]KNC84844.1 hypothetical protein SARC_02955 [Sphaeroforma arctica JP610]|eukprot:XP_014158746.1 hypothetical protein SARC_02955 [Sphaeroforma arctica JP610]